MSFVFCSPYCRWLLGIILVLNGVLFLLNRSGVRVRWDDRLWPSWFFLLMAVFLAAGWLTALKSKRFWVMFSLFFFCTISSGAADSGKKIALVRSAKILSDSVIADAVETDSERHPEGGYHADRNVVDCFAEMEYLYTGGRYLYEPVRFRMLFPKRLESGKTYPLIVWLHGRGESGNDNERQLAHLQVTLDLLAGSDRPDFFMIATQCPQDNSQWTRSISTSGKGDAPLAIAGEILEAAVGEFPIDRDRITVFGLSSGASAAWELTEQYAGTIAALVPCSGSPPPHLRAESFKETTIWAFNNRGDAGVPFEETAFFLEQINRLGGHAYMSLDNRSGHNAWERALRDEKVLLWMIAQSLGNPTPPIDGKSLFDLQAVVQEEGEPEVKLRLLEPGLPMSTWEANRLLKSSPVPRKSGVLFPQEKLADLFSVMEYRYTGGRYQNSPILFRMYSPQNIDPRQDYPLVIWLHDRSESGDDNRRQLLHLEKCADFFTDRKRGEFFLIAFQCPEDNPDWVRTVPREAEGDIPLAILGEIMESVIREHPINEDAVTLFGFGTGAEAALAFSEKHPGRIAALVLGNDTLPERIADANLRPAIWFFYFCSAPHKPYDIVLFREYWHEFVTGVNEDGGNFFLSESPVQPNENRLDHPLRRMKTLGWLLAQNRSISGPPQGIVCEHRSVFQQILMFGAPLLILITLGWYILVRTRNRKESP